MSKLLDPETLPLLAFFVLPGYLSWCVWRIIVPVRTTRLSDSLVAILMLGLLNYILVGGAWAFRGSSESLDKR